MKFETAAAIALYLASTADAFSVVGSPAGARGVVGRTPASTRLYDSAVRPDASSAVNAALEASKKYGASSPEARLAWEAVEEMDASDNRWVNGRSIRRGCLFEP